MSGSSKTLPWKNLIHPRDNDRVTKQWKISLLAVMEISLLAEALCCSDA
jgi:hypothetical protein